MNNRIDSIINSILWAKSFADVVDSQQKSRQFILRSLSIKEVNLLNYIYNQELDIAINAGILKQDDLKIILEKTGTWNQENEEKIIFLERQEKILASQIRDFEFFTAKKKKAEKEIKQIKEEISELKNIKIELFNNSAETRAEEVMRRYLIMLSAEDIHERQYWTSKESFLQEKDFTLVYNLAISYYKNNMFDEKTLREVARSPQWRIKWFAFKNGADLFDRAVPNWSEMQNYIVYWSQYYDFVFESIERPSDSVIQNDEALDAWVKDQSKKIKSQSSGDKNIMGTKKASHKKDHNEHFIMVQKGDKEAIQKVQNMNTADVRSQLQGEYNIIKEKKKVSEWQLRHSKT